MPLLARRRPAGTASGRPRPQPMPRALAASAQVLSLTDKEQVKRWGNIRPGWQAEAWAYRRNLGELRYATAYLGNSSMRIRLFPAAYRVGDEVPVPVEQAPDIPPDLAAAANTILLRLATGGPLALSMMQKKMTENFEVAGETFLVGETDPLTGLEEWSLKSTSELFINKGGEAKVLEYPGATNQDARTLDPDNTFISRLWWPDPEWGLLADSPVRSILDLCEELLLLGKDVRATARSRLALNGVLAVPDTLSIVGANPEMAQDPSQDPFWQMLIETVTSALTNEGSAAAVVPLMMRGPAEALAAIRHIEIKRDVHDKNIEQRQELITRMATGLDLPSEVLTGKVDLNHWTAWQVNDDAFRHHIEPIQVVENDAWTAGFLWPMLDAYNTWDPALIRRIIVWHDPTELLTHPDRSQDAFSAWDRFAISDEALRRYLGFPDTDSPDANELLVRIVTKARSLDPALVDTILKRLDPSLPTPALNPPAGAPALPAGPPSSGQPAPEPAPEGPPPTGGQAAAMQYVVEAMATGIAQFIQSKSEPIVVHGPRVITASTGPTPQQRAASRALVDIDRELRAKLHTAANAAVKRALERAGAKVVSKARGKGAEAVRASISGVPAHRVVRTVGAAVVAALGLDAAELSRAEFNELEQQYRAWVETANQQALRQAARIAGVDVNTMYGLFADKTSRFAQDTDAGWNWLAARLQTTVAAEMAAAPVGEEVTVSADETFVGMNLVRGALAIAGGYNSNPTSSGLTDAGYPADSGSPLTGIATGDTVTSTLSDAGAATAGYEWVHGPSSNPFEPHLNLDGVQFENFDDPALANEDSFPDYAFFAPGDHDGCSCDAMPVWVSGGGTDGSSDGEEG